MVVDARARACFLCRPNQCWICWLCLLVQLQKYVRSTALPTILLSRHLLCTSAASGRPHGIVVVPALVPLLSLCTVAALSAVQINCIWKASRHCGGSCLSATALSLHCSESESWMHALYSFVLAFNCTLTRCTQLHRQPFSNCHASS